MVECSGLENRRGFASSVGSNPTLSAKQKGLPKGSPFFLADRAVLIRTHRFDRAAQRAAKGRRQRRRGAAPSEASPSHPLGARKARPSLSVTTQLGLLCRSKPPVPCSWLGTLTIELRWLCRRWDEPCCWLVSLLDIEKNCDTFHGSSMGKHHR